MLVDEVALILKGQNVAGPSVAAVTAELKALRTATLSVTKALGEYNSVLDRTMSMTKGMSTTTNIPIKIKKPAAKPWANNHHVTKEAMQ